ncbi:MAG: calcium-binding protein [Phenylobacterium sp.]|uniref:calcium-binding protein n=1 Tax=Phenylobacterium sp. TaxID=1871053 RepID=UPI002732E531|nr:calcium-binding protein [Phenylobacterium sp.]MDP3749837.1 calcium-binding protein [Phenylobacterium sp.]
MYVQYTLAGQTEYLIKILSTGDYIHAYSHVNVDLAFTSDLVTFKYTFYDYILGGTQNVYHFADGDYDNLQFEYVSSLAPYMSSSPGNDVSGTAGADNLSGGPGDDSIAAGAGNDAIFAGFEGLAGGIDAVDGGDGADTLSATYDGQVIAVSSLTNVEVVTSGGHSNVTLAGSFQKDVLNLSGVQLVDILSVSGGSGNDTLVGSNGADTLLGDSGADSLAGGGGNDVFYFDDAPDKGDVIDGGSGADTIMATTDHANIVLNGMSGIEAISANGHVGVEIVSTVAVNLDFSNVTLTNISGILGSAQTDTLIGSSGNDTFLYYDLAGLDYDIIDGGPGHDQILAGESWAYFMFQSIRNVEVISGNGYEGVKLYIPTDGQVSNFSNVHLIDIEEIVGTTAADTIIGSTSSDRFVSDGGADLMTGGAGSDVFAYYALSDSSVATGRDTITDFNLTQDKLDLSMVDANSTVLGRQHFSYIGTAPFTSTAGELRYTAGNAGVTLSGDINGDGQADFEIQLGSIYSISSSNFIL